MGLIKIFPIFFSFFSSVILSAKVSFPVLLTKQSISSLRYISSDGKFTYYQKRNGEILLSTNYKIIPLIKDVPGTLYQVIASPAKKKILISKENSEVDRLAMKAPKTIYQLDFGQKKSEELGKGLSPQLHLNDQWATFYGPYSYKIQFKNLINPGISFDLTLKTPINPYFIPEVVFFDNDKIYYTDLDKKGIPGLVQYSRISESFHILYKAHNHNVKIQICKSRNALYIGEFPINNDQGKSQIFSLHFDQKNKEVLQNIYTSNLQDRGNMICHPQKNEIYFIKAVHSSHEIAKLNLQTNKISIVSTLESATQIYPMDTKILTTFQGKVYLVEGKNNLGIDEFKIKGPQ